MPFLNNPPIYPEQLQPDQKKASLGKWEEGQDTDLLRQHIDKISGGIKEQ